MRDLKSYYGIKNASETEIIIEKSHFISACKPVTTEEEAKEFVESRRKLHYNATHNVFSYVIKDKQNIERYSDDGEPQGTAGLPVINLLKVKHIENICIVITRYFGGIKLGKGGLVRAYTNSAKSAINKSLFILRKPFAILHLSVDYPLLGKVQNEIKSAEIRVKDIVYTDKTEFFLYIAFEDYDKTKAKFTDITYGTAVMDFAGEEYVDIIQDEI